MRHFWVGMKSFWLFALKQYEKMPPVPYNEREYRMYIWGGRAGAILTGFVLIVPPLVILLM